MSKFKLCPPEKPYYFMTVEEGKTYAWCSCEKSKNQPFCDGSHSGSEKKPYIYKAEETRDVAFCGCRKTASVPFCDGAHKKL
jgi:CDGSH-type Zn-finger protein